MFQDFPTAAPAAAAPVKQANSYLSPPLQRPMPQPVYLQRPLQQQQQQHNRPQANICVMPENAMSWQQEIEIMCRDLLHR